MSLRCQKNLVHWERNKDTFRNSKASDLNREDFRSVLHKIGFSISIQDTLLDHRMNGRIARNLDHSTLSETFGIIDYCDRKRLIVLSDRLSSDKLQWLIESIELFQNEMSRSQIRPLFLFRDDSDVERIEEILSFNLNNVGNIVGWNQQQVIDWIRGCHNIHDLESVLSPFKLTGFVLNHSSDQELEEFVKPRLPRASDFLAFAQELKVQIGRAHV